MTDFEEQVGATLAAVAEEAPDASGLAAGARRRHRVRRQRRIAVGGVAAALVVAVSAVALGTRDSGNPDIAEDPTETPSGAWQTISSGPARAEIPSDWKALECGEEPDLQTSYGPADSEPCTADRLRTFWMDSAEGYSADEAGEVIEGRDEQGAPYWLGSVSAGDRVLVVGTADPDLTRQILATARLEGQPVVDASQWVSFERNGVGYEVPAFWGVGEKGDRSGYTVCTAPAAIRMQTGEQVDDRSYRIVGQFRTLRVTLTAPTQAVAELVWASVTDAPDAVGDGGCAEEDFNVGLLSPEGSSGEPVEGSQSASVPGTTADAAIAFGADLARFHAAGEDYPIDMFAVESLMKDGDLAPFQPGNQLNIYFRLTTQPGVLFCLVNETTGEYAAYDSTAGGLIGQGTTDPGGVSTFDDRCAAEINDG